jgi:excinuclease ABC subunit A
MDIIKSADYIIDMGPEGGNGGGTLVMEGEPECFIAQQSGVTASFLASELKK